MSRQQIVLLVSAHIAKYGSTPDLDELLRRLDTDDKFVIFEFEHVQALSQVMYVYGKQPTQSSW